MWRRCVAYKRRMLFTLQNHVHVQIVGWIAFEAEGIEYVVVANVTGRVCLVGFGVHVVMLTLRLFHTVSTRGCSRTLRRINNSPWKQRTKEGPRGPRGPPPHFCALQFFRFFVSTGQASTRSSVHILDRRIQLQRRYPLGGA